MKNITLNYLLIGLIFYGYSELHAQEYTTEVIEIWDNGTIPFNKETIELEEMLDEENKRFSQISNPTLYIYRKAGVENSGPALLHCPGGGYANVTIGTDRGESYAKLFLDMGFNVVAVLKYRLPDGRIVNEQDKVPLCDAQKALAIVHRNAKNWKIDKKKIGVMGSSAGGHLAASLANLQNNIIAPGVKKKELKLAFSILLYPVISFNLPYRHKGSYKRLLGDQSNNQEFLDYYSMENQVTKKTPPTLLVHAEDDRSVVYQNSVIFADQLATFEVPYKYIQLKKGGHGFGLNRARVDREWVPEIENWLKHSGILQNSGL